MKRFIILTLLIFLTIKYNYSQTTNSTNGWTVGIYNIKSYDTTTSSIATSIKSSISLILSKRFNIVRIDEDTIDKKELLKRSVKGKIDFVIYGFIIKKDHQTYTLILQLQDVANESIKLSRDYSFEYNPDLIFEAIDKIVADFSDGILRVVPKYEENLAIEYRKKIKEKETLFRVPGNFFVSLLLNNYTTIQDNYTSSIIYPSISFRYVNDTEGGIFGKGWFSYIEIPDPIVSLRLFQDSQESSSFFFGKEAKIGLGTKIVNYFGLGIEFLIVKEFKFLFSYNSYNEVRNLMLSFTLYPSFYITILDKLSIFFSEIYYSPQGFSLSLKIGDLSDSNIEILKLSSTTLKLVYNAFDIISIEGKIQYNIVEASRATFINNNTDISIGIGISRKFYF
ncbi:MAG: hypothetical protein ACP5PT_07520 [Brevinematia bacterium]